jgi:hypothetical protein
MPPAPEERWIALPSAARPRFILPATTRLSAFGGLAVYHPVTRRALVGWSIARVAARLGAFRLLSSVEAPADLDAIHAWYPSALVAISHSQRATGHTGLVLDRMGRPLGFVKVAGDAAGTEKLAREVASIRGLGALLPPPVSAPTHVRSAPGMLCFEAASWQPRFRPWELAPDVAAALGTLYRRGGGNDRRGPAHGDFAPWNLLRLAAGGWLLADWEDATADGWPFEDPFHWLVQSHALLGRPSRRSLLDGVHGTGWVGRALDAYATAAGLEQVVRRDAFRAYLERTSAASVPMRGRHDREVTARIDLLVAITRPDARPDGRKAP